MSQPSPAAAYVAIVDDDPAIRTALGRALRMENYDVELFEDGSSAIKSIQLRAPDAIVLDLQLPDLDGLEVCRLIRRGGDTTPILMLTARIAVNDRVEGLDVGADDFLRKPFERSVLMARLHALLRRQERGRPQQLSVGAVTLNPVSRQVVAHGRPVTLTPREFSLLEFLMSHANTTLSKAEILDVVWGSDFDGDQNIVEVYVGYLRRKIDVAGAPSVIRTVRGLGYSAREV